MNKKIMFEEIDLRCLKEIPLIVDVLASTFQKLTSVFDSLHEELTDLITPLLPKGWEIDSKTERTIFSPLTTSRSKISVLEEHFSLDYSIYLTKRIKDKIGDKVWVTFGYYYAVNEYDSLPVYYIQIGRNVPKGTPPLNAIDFYKKLKKLTPVETTIFHPSQKDSWEGFDLYTSNLNLDSLQMLFESVRDNILPTLLKSLP